MTNYQIASQCLAAQPVGRSAFQGKFKVMAWALAIGLSVLACPGAAHAQIVDISAGSSGWGCSQCNGPQNVLPGTQVNLVNTGESGPLQVTLGPGTYTITNGASSGTYSAWNFQGYPNSGNWVWSFMVGADTGNNTATVLMDDYTSLIAGTQAAQASATGVQTYDGNTLLSATTTAGFTDTLSLSKTTTLDFFIDDYYLADNGGGVALNIQPSPVPLPPAWALLLTGFVMIPAMARGKRRRRRSGALTS